MTLAPATSMPGAPVFTPVSAREPSNDVIVALRSALAVSVFARAPLSAAAAMVLLFCCSHGVDCSFS